MSLHLSLSGIWKYYDGNPILRDCSYAFDAPGIYALTGPNGSGKSTFLRICALLEAPDQGEVAYYSGPSRLPCDIGLKRRITLVLPKVGIFNTSVYNNIAYGLRIRGLAGVEVKEKVARALEQVGLEHKKNQNALTLSSGETQRLGIARALVVEPEVLFLDEPTASIDQKNTEIIEELILRMKKAGRSTVIIATHDPEQTHRLADRVLTIVRGQIQNG